MTTEPKPNVTLPGTFSLLATTFSIYRKHFGTIIGFSSWLLVPLVISLLAFLSFEKDAALLVDFVCNIFVYTLLTVWLSVVVISLTPHLRKDRVINTASIGTTSWNLLIPYLLVGIIVSLINLTGFVLLLIPGFIVSTLFAFSGIVVVLEKAHLSEAMKKSFRLTRPIFFQVFVRLYLGLALLLLMYFVLMLGVEAIDMYVSHTTIETAIFSEPTILDETLYRLIEILILPAVILYQTLLYIAVRKAGPKKESGA